MGNVKFPDMHIHEELLVNEDVYKVINLFCDELKTQLPNLGHSKRESMTYVTRFLFECQEVMEAKGDVRNLIRVWANVQ